MAGTTYLSSTSEQSKELIKGYVGNENNHSVNVNKIYVGNNSNKSVKVYPAPILPFTYQQVEYIYNTNRTEYIDTGIKPNSNTRSWLDIYVKKPSYNTYSTYTAYRGCFGTNYGQPGKYAIDIYANDNRDTEFCDIYFGDAGSQELTPVAQRRYTSSNLFSGKRHTIEINRQGGYMYIDNVQVGQSSHTFGSYSSPITIFCKNSNYGPDYEQSRAAELYLYQFKAWQDNTLIRDMYPCYRKSDSVVGMYDIVNDVFYTNAGTGIFYKGPNV